MVGSDEIANPTTRRSHRSYKAVTTIPFRHGLLEIKELPDFAKDLTRKTKSCLSFPSKIYCMLQLGRGPQFYDTLKGDLTQNPPILLKQGDIQRISTDNSLDKFDLKTAGIVNKAATIKDIVGRVKRTAEAPNLAKEFKVICYFTSWSWHRKGVGTYLPSAVDPSLCSHIVYAFAELDTTSLNIKPRDPRTDIDKEFYKKVAALKRNGTKVSLSIGGWSDSAGDKYSRLVNNPKSRTAFVRNVTIFLEKYGFDGLDLDWEYPKCWQGKCQEGPRSDKPAFTAFVKELKTVFKPKGLLLSAAVSSNKKVIDEAYEVGTLSENLDWIAIMTYAYTGAWSKKTGHASPLFRHAGDIYKDHNANFSVNHWIQSGADPRKLVLGMAFYGRSFTLVNASDNGLYAPTSRQGEPGEVTRAKGVLAYYEICERTRKRNWKVVPDSTGAMGPYAFKDDQWVAFDDPDMIRKKSRWIREMNLGGGMIWALDFDDFANVCECEKYPLLKTINRELGRLHSKDPRCRLTVG